MIYLKIIYKINHINSTLYRFIKYVNSNYVKNRKDMKFVISHYFFIN